MSRVEGNLWANAQEKWKMDEMSSFCDVKSVISSDFDIKLHIQLYPLLCNRFGKRSIFYSISDVVNLRSTSMFSNKILFYMLFQLIFLKDAFRMDNTIQLFTDFHRSIWNLLLFNYGHHFFGDFLHYILLFTDHHTWRYQKRHQWSEWSCKNQSKR